ncbi:hypothetical protein BD311DRAFT_797652 [Dichomitus squalens]|uniref:Uncharacterized protein n=1 Tax=Dichomitus squalens TaxID=114155 RepID=A0A4Q9MKR8_9APHY|nr:hypothetical protein BD311DRAFT_797652 [Dichomitus squalens]
MYGEPPLRHIVVTFASDNAYRGGALDVNPGMGSLGVGSSGIRTDLSWVDVRSSNSGLTGKALRPPTVVYREAEGVQGKRRGKEEEADRRNRARDRLTGIGVTRCDASTRAVTRCTLCNIAFHLNPALDTAAHRRLAKSSSPNLPANLKLKRSDSSEVPSTILSHERRPIVRTEGNEANYYQRCPILSPIAMTVRPSASESLTYTIAYLRHPTAVPPLGPEDALTKTQDEDLEAQPERAPSTQFHKSDPNSLRLVYTIATSLSFSYDNCAAILKLHLEVVFSEESPWHPSLSSLQYIVPQSGSRLFEIGRSIYYVLTKHIRNGTSALIVTCQAKGRRPGCMPVIEDGDCLYQAQKSKAEVQDSMSLRPLDAKRSRIGDCATWKVCHGANSGGLNLSIVHEGHAGATSDNQSTSGIYTRTILSVALTDRCFTTLVLVAFMALLKQWHTHRFTTVVLGSTLVPLYASTTTAFIITILEMQVDILMYIFSTGNLAPSIISSLLSGPSNYGSCANTAALTILLGDSIVCWRASLLWPGNRVVRGVSIVLLLTAFALGAVDLRYTCYSLNTHIGSSINGNAVVTGGMYGGTPYGLAASVLSFLAYKAWRSRKFLRKFMVSGDRNTQVERLFSILIETGMVYCAIWIIVVVWQFSVYDRFGNFMDIGLVTIIDYTPNNPPKAIYPAVVIILVAQNRSHIEKAFGGGAVNTPEPSHWNGIRAPSATVLHIARQGDRAGDGSEESSTHAADDWKMESGGIA